MANLKGIARWVVRVGVSAGIIAYILYDVDREHLWRAVTAVRPTSLIAPLMFYLGGQLLSGIKWAMLGRSVGLDRPVADYIRFYFVGMFFNVFGPSTIGGDVARGLYLGDGRRPVLALNSVIFDRVSGLAMLMALGAAALLAFPQYDLPWPLSASLIAGGTVLVVGWWMCPRLVKLLPAKNRLRHQVETDLAPFWRDSRLLVWVGLVSLAFHITQVGVQYLLARAAGTDLPFSYCMIIHPVLSVMLALPFSVGGFGVREGGYLYFLTRLDIDDSVAVTMGLLWFAITAAGGLIGGLVFLADGARLPSLRAHPVTRAPDVA